MTNLFKFSVLRPVQELTEEKQRTIGTATHADGNVSQWSVDILNLCSQNDHEQLYVQVFNFLRSNNAIESYDKLSALLKETVMFLRLKGRKATANDFNHEFTRAKIKNYFKPTNSDGSPNPEYYIKEKQNVEDTLLALAIFGKLGNKGNINYQLVFKAIEILKQSFANNGVIAQSTLTALLQKPIMIPYCRYNKCTKKWEPNTPFAYLKLDKTVPVPTQNQPPDNTKTPCDCDCKCDDETCHCQGKCCAEIKPFVADLMVVREELVCYKPEHIAYIENIMLGERRERVYRTLDRVETLSETETSTTKSLEKDQEVEDRFSLKSQIEKTIEEDLSISAGVELSGEFGTNKYSAHFDMSYDLAKSESQNIAQEYARNVVTRSVSKVEETVRQLNSTKRISEIEETNTHTFDNTSPSAVKHIVGQYHFVNMINRAQVMNYGKRLMFEFVLPEPMELYKKLIAKNVAPFGLTEPKSPPVRIDQINPGPLKADGTPTEIYSDNTDSSSATHYDPNGLFNYQDLIKFYGLTGIDPMPDSDIMIPFSFENQIKAEGENQTTTFTVTLATIPQGYNGRNLKIEIKGYDFIGDFQSVSPSVPPFTGVDPEIFWFIDGVNSGLIGGGVNSQQIAIDAMQGATLSMSAIAKSNVGIAGSGWVQCLLSEQAKAQWKTRVFEQIQAKYQQQLEDYKTALARYQQEKDAKLPFGENPFINREIERTELKRLAISYISCQFYDQFTAMKRNVAPCGYPEMDLEQAQTDGSFVQFFEELFDWNLMTYLFYPYFWGQKCSWAEKVQTNSNDPLFDKALAAGAARVQVPVRLGHEPLAMHWIAYGEIWEGQTEPPLPTSDYYVSMAQEIKEQKNCYFNDRSGELEAVVGHNWVTLSGTDYYWDVTGPSPVPPPVIIGSPNQVLIDADIDREIMINCEVYRVVKIVEGVATYDAVLGTFSYVPDITYHKTWTIHLERVFEGQGCCGCDHLAAGTIVPHIKYQMGAVFVGAPFEVIVPTNLVFLRNTKDPVTGNYFSSDCLPCYPLDNCE
jgi:hypothetical protein